MRLRLSLCVALATLVLLSGCPNPPPDPPAIELMLTRSGMEVDLCWTDDALYTEDGSRAITGRRGVLTPAEVAYRVHRRPIGMAFTFDANDLVLELQGDAAEANAAGMCGADLEFGATNGPPGPGQWCYSVCRSVDGELSGCAIIRAIGLFGTPDGGPSDAGTDAGGSPDAGGATDAGDAGDAG